LNYTRKSAQSRSLNPGKKRCPATFFKRAKILTVLVVQTVRIENSSCP